MSTNAPTLFDTDTTGRFHVDDPWTSKEAARRVAVRAGTDRYRVLEALVDAGTNGLTDYELGARLGILTTTAGTRRGELAANEPPLVVPVDDLKRRTDTGRPAQVWRATLPGVQRLAAARHDRGITRPAPLARYGAKPPGRTIQRTRSRYGLTTARDRILEELVHTSPTSGLTDEQLAACIGMLRTAIGTARKQLVDDGLVETLDQARPTLAGNRAAVHRITAAGRIRLDELARRQ